MIEYAIETENLTKKFGKDVAVNSINMNIEKGKIYGLLGRNGAGKTTTMCMLLNLSKPTSGKINLFGEPYLKHPQKTYSKIGSIIETPGFYENLNAYENLKIISKLRGNYNKKTIDEALNLVCLYDAKYKKFKDFSLGMKQRLGIAAAIMHNPDLLILDEPINGLDPVGIKEIRELLKTLAHDYGITILISSHILSEIEHIADIIGVMDHGNLIEELSKEELENKLNKYVDFEVSNIREASEILKKSGFKENMDFIIKKTPENELLLRLINHLNLRDEINEIFVKSGIKVSKLILCEESLEEFFTRLIGDEIRFS
ncbi:ABC transporter ATP-binding protein [uncultured Methanobrevibacter sp.]|uniref:ABC transporter ATP-binding protein n=1 Tax=uncultured Methanobrevibacter sp. TaxID=253161 RepID=UPI00260B7BE4|nr:ATP-binding cassette domain-containing protein [uncultured Methanobrevibacter sp.]